MDLKRPVLEIQRRVRCDDKSKLGPPSSGFSARQVPCYSDRPCLFRSHE